MWNLRSLKMSVMLVASGVALVAALPAVAQQVVLTPGGTMIQPIPQAPVAEKSLLDYMMSGEQRETTYYPGEIAPGTGIDPKPGDFNEINPGRVVDTGAEPIILEIDPDALIGGPSGMRYSDLYPELPTNNKPDPVSTLTPEEVAEAYHRGEIFYPHGFSATNQAAANSLSSESATVPGEIMGTSSQGSNSIVSPKQLNSPSAASVTLPSVTVQASQNPTADFATTRSAPRNTVPEQLNRGVADSPLSNSRIFPGMR
jgi:hypothetical protein